VLINTRCVRLPQRSAAYRIQEQSVPEVPSRDVA